MTDVSKHYGLQLKSEFLALSEIQLTGSATARKSSVDDVERRHSLPYHQ